MKANNKNIFKRALYLLFTAALSLAVILGAAGISACDTDDDGRTKIVCTIFPQYDWLNNILGDNAENYNIILLTESGTDLHNYQPTVADIASIGSCELFIYTGGESDSWVDNAISSSKTKAELVCMMDLVEAKEEESVEGMEEEEEEDGDETEYDEHVWLSLRNAELIVNAIAEKVCLLDSENSSYYQANAAAYIKELEELDAEYTAVVEASSVKTLLFADRFPFRYFVDDYGLSYYAAFKGCSTESQASFATITTLATKLNELNLKYVLVLEGSDKSIANSVISNAKELSNYSGTSVQILEINSCQVVKKADISAGTTYLSIMESNLTVIETALS
ncbi:MAG: metal ABC transporter substrate-binding protein [Clostridia bacterium]|nr:metal ABC transporter substrate-binding protein [Clostridia bacterium]